MERYGSDSDLHEMWDLYGEFRPEDDPGPLGIPFDYGEDDEVEDNSHNHEENAGYVPSQGKPMKEKKAVLNPQPKLNFDLLRGPNGLLALNDMAKNFKFKGNGREQEDLANVLKKLEQWLFRLYPKYHFEDSLKRLEALGKRREVQVYLRKIRNGVLDDDVVRQVDDDDDVEMMDPFDDLNQRKNDDRFDALLNEQVKNISHFDDNHPMNDLDRYLKIMPDYRPVSPTPPPRLTDEQRARMERNRQLALEKKQKIAEEHAKLVAERKKAVEDAKLEADRKKAAEVEAEKKKAEEIAKSKVVIPVCLDSDDEDLMLTPDIRDFIAKHGDFY